MSPSASVSFASTAIVIAAFAGVVAVSPTATGARFGCTTVTLTVAVAVPPRPSAAVYVNESGPA